jgi:hypothetical protein
MRCVTDDEELDGSSGPDEGWDDWGSLHVG